MAVIRKVEVGVVEVDLVGGEVTGAEDLEEDSGEGEDITSGGERLMRILLHYGRRRSGGSVKGVLICWF